MIIRNLCKNCNPHYSQLPSAANIWIFETNSQMQVARRKTCHFLCSSISCALFGMCLDVLVGVIRCSLLHVLAFVLPYTFETNCSKRKGKLYGTNFRTSTKAVTYKSKYARERERCEIDYIQRCEIELLFKKANSGIVQMNST